MHTKTRVYNLIIYVLLCKYAQNECAIQVWHSAHAISTQHHAVHTAVVWVEKKQKKKKTLHRMQNLILERE